MNTPESIKPHADDYFTDTWKKYTLEELGQWVSLLAKRSHHRLNKEKRTKDLYDAQNYLNMMQAHISALREES